MDGANQLNYSETLSYAEDNSISTHLQSPCEVGDPGHHGASPQETSVVPSLSHQTTARSLETKTAFITRDLKILMPPTAPACGVQRICLTIQSYARGDDNKATIC